MLKIIDRYILQQVFKSTIAAIALFVLIWIAPETLFEIIQKLISHDISFTQAVKLFSFEVPLILGRAIPFGLLLGCLYTFDKLSRDFELTIFRSIGVSLIRIVRPIIILSVVLAVLCFYTYDRLIPSSRVALDDIKGHKSNLHMVYMQKSENGAPKQIIIIPRYDGKFIYNPSVLKLVNSDGISSPLMENIYTAPKGTIDENQITIFDGNDYVLSSDGVYKEIKSFESKVITQGEVSSKVLKLLKFQSARARNLTNAQLQEYISLLKSEGLMDEYRYMKNKLYQRFFHSLSCILLAICGVVLGYSRPRETRVLGFTMGVGIIFIYFVTIPFLDMLAQKAILAPVVSAGLPSCFILLATYFIIKSKQI